MKDKIIEILNGYRENVSNDSSVDNYAIEERDFNELANDLVKKLTMPVVVGQSEQLNPLPPNECDRCGVLIDHRLNECGCCYL
ncbi:hypothetical protein [Seonamhaeicola sp.]|uniref:hypothetical protein n=1 Tax=Seonamhaeicola sp. TaxID=1912245 RepID=UPI003564C979